MAHFMFATGIENSNPTLQGGRVRVDQMRDCGHDNHYELDFDLAVDLGVNTLRYGAPLHRTFTGPGQYDWTFADATFGALRRRPLLVIADLCHFGVPDWLGDFQNPDFPEQFAAYAGAFARRYPWVQLYTPVNEMYICALFSGKYGWWNEALTTDRGFVTALKHLVRANVLAMHAILEVRPDALFIQSESTEQYHARVPGVLDVAAFLNETRFLSLDLNYGRDVSARMLEYLLDNGLTREEYAFFLGHRLKPHCVMGNDYYVTNEHCVYPDGHLEPSGDVFGYAMITREYFDRYRLPVMHSETNAPEGPLGREAVDWLIKVWANVIRIRNDGVPVMGFTWYSLTDQVDWDTGLRERHLRPYPVGLFDLERRVRPVGTAYRDLIRAWQDVLPTQSVALTLPLAPAAPVTPRSSAGPLPRQEQAEDMGREERGRVSAGRAGVPRR